MYKWIRTLLSQFIHPAFTKQNSQSNKVESLSQTINKSSETSTNDSICSLEIQMNSDGTINIVCGWPDFHDENKTKIPTIAQQYALIIDAMNSGMLSKEILNTIKYYNSHNTMDILFAQNVIFKLTELSFLKKQHQSISEPVIRPTDVFRQASR